MAARKSGDKFGFDGRFQHGHDARRGRGPQKGSGGRPAIAIREQCRALVDKITLPRIAEYVAEIEDGPADAGWRWCHEQLVKLGIARQELVDSDASEEPFRFTLDIGGDGSREC